MVRACILSGRLTATVFFVLCVVGTAAAQSSQSATLAKQLVTAMGAAGLDALAARDPNAADRFVAVLAFPGTQLLVVSAPYPTPAVLDALLAQRQYRDIYITLQQPSIKQGKLFIQDLGCDGLQSGTDGNVDLMYENASSQTIFDGNWKRLQLSESQYQKRLRDADARYSQMLMTLLSAATAGARGAS
jgi:hypothetical protein